MTGQITQQKIKKHSPVQEKPKVLILTTSLLVDRTILYSGVLKKLSQQADVTVWAGSYKGEQYKELWHSAGVMVEEFPHIKPFPSIYTKLRRVNEFSWDYKQKPISRMSLSKYRDDDPLRIKMLKPFGKIISTLNIPELFEDKLESLLVSYNRSEDAYERLKKLKASVVFTTGPFQFHQPAVCAAAINLGIPVLALIPSWDNISTKKRLQIKYDGYAVWSEKTKTELQEMYEYTRSKPTYVTGAAQFDVFFQKSFYKTREEYCRSQNLDPNRPIILYALGSPNFLKEHHGALRLAEYVQKGFLGNSQLLVRPHPAHDKGEINEAFDKFKPNVVIQKLGSATDAVDNFDPGFKLRMQDNNSISEWINTFRHADVVVNTASTVAIDAAILDRPIINLDFDTQPGQADQQLINEINHKWVHYKPVAESGGVWLVKNYDEMMEAIKAYIANPELHQEKRRWIAEYVCGFVDGKCGERMADAILDFAARSQMTAQKTEKVEKHVR